MSPRQLNLWGASCWLDVPCRSETRSRYSWGMSETILTQWPLRKLRPYVEILKALTVFNLWLDVKRNFGVNWNLLDYDTLLKVMVLIHCNVNRAQTVFYILHTNYCWRFMTQVISHGKRCHVSWCQQNTNDVTRITRQMIKNQRSSRPNCLEAKILASASALAS